MVEKLPEANTVEVTHALQDKLDELKPGLQGVKVNASFYRPAAYIQASDNNLNDGADHRRGARTPRARCLPVQPAHARRQPRVRHPGARLPRSSCSRSRGETINAMVLAGLVLALVVLVDDAVVSADTIRRDLVRAEGDGAEVATTRRFLGGDCRGPSPPDVRARSSRCWRSPRSSCSPARPARSCRRSRSRTAPRSSRRSSWRSPSLRRWQCSCCRGSRPRRGRLRSSGGSSRAATGSSTGSCARRAPGSSPGSCSS